MNQYGQLAAETFAHSLGGITQQPVRIEFRGNFAYTDGTTIVIPLQSCWDQTGFRTACGLITHEHTHIWFRSHKFHTDTLQAYSEEDRSLVANIVNAILDVADETRFIAIMPGADDLFTALAESALDEARRADALPKRPRGRVTLWQLLSAGIWLVRSKPQSQVRRAFWGWRRRVDGMRDVYRILDRARDRSRPNGLNPRRSQSEWKQMGDLVSEMYARLSPLYPPDKPPEPKASQPEQQPSPELQPNNSTDPRGRWNKIAVKAVHPGTGNGAKTPKQPDNDGSPPPDPNAGSGKQKPPDGGGPAADDTKQPASPNPTAADPRKGSDTATRPTSGKSPTSPLDAAISDILDKQSGWGTLLPGSVDGGLGPADRRTGIGRVTANLFEPTPTPVAYDAAIYHKVYPAFVQTARALATGPTLNHEHGHLSGNRIGRPYRALIDGRCFRRSTYQESIEAAAALLFDHSHSMREILPVFLPVGAAMADALAAQSDVTVAVWRFGRKVERLKRIGDLEDARLMGSTMTHDALRQARDWLDSETADLKVAVLLTDGEPSRIKETFAEIVELRRRGVRLLVGSIGLARDKCARSFPGTIVFDVEPSQAACSLQTAIRRIQQ